MDALAYRIDTEDRSIVISGDTAPCQQLIELATGADVLVHEVMHVPSIEPLLARTNGVRLRQHLLDSHTSVSEVGALAESAGVQTLVLSHFVPSDPPSDRRDPESETLRWIIAMGRSRSHRELAGARPSPHLRPASPSGAW
ncbi:MBL fold metallo-hydrolase [Saccharopolyspora sp. NPDC002376]